MTPPAAESIPFSTERLVARPWRPEDPADIGEAGERLTDPEVRRWVGEGRPVGGRERVRRCLEHAIDRCADGLGVWALQRRSDEAVVGEVAVVPLPGHERVEVGWHLDRRWWGRGYATEAARAAVAYGVDVLGLPELVAVVDPRNGRSRAVARRAGLRPAGRLRAYGRSLDAFRLAVAPVDHHHVRLRPVEAGVVVGLRQRVLRPHVAPSALLADHDLDPVDVAALTLERCVVGCARLSRQAPAWDTGDDRAWRLRNMAVSARARRLGIGRRLVDEVVARAVDLGAARLWCAARLPAEGFYARAGFARAGEPWHDPMLGWHVPMDRALP